MTNKVKPFFIRITSDMTPQMVQDAFDKCVDAGDKCDEWEAPLELTDWEFFGFCGVSGMYLTDYSEDYEANHLGRPQEITLDQIDEWLGVDKEAEWKNGDKCIAFCVECIFIGKSHLRDCDSVIMMSDGTLKHYQTCMLSKPETPEQKAERERLEAIKEITDFLNNLSPHCKEKMEYVAREIVDKTNYRKQ